MARKKEVKEDVKEKDFEVDPYSQIEPNLPEPRSQEPVVVNKEVCDNPEGC